MSNVRTGFRYLLYCTLLFVVSAGSVSGMEVQVHMPTGQTLSIQAEPESTVGDVKGMIFDITNIHMLNQIMFKDGKKLDDDKTLASYGISDKDTLTVKYGSQSSGTKKKGYGGYLKILLPLIVIAVIAYKIKKIMSDE